MLNGITRCALADVMDGGIVPETDAGTIVLCCPASASESVAMNISLGIGAAVTCEGPFQ